MQGPLRATLADFDSLIELVDISFSGDKDRGGGLPDPVRKAQGEATGRPGLGR